MFNTPFNNCMYLSLACVDVTFLCTYKSTGFLYCIASFMYIIYNTYIEKQKSSCMFLCGPARGYLLSHEKKLNRKRLLLTRKLPQVIPRGSGRGLPYPVLTIIILNDQNITCVCVTQVIEHTCSCLPSSLYACIALVTCRLSCFGL